MPWWHPMVPAKSQCFSSGAKVPEGSSPVPAIVNIWSQASSLPVETMEAIQAYLPSAAKGYLPPYLFFVGRAN